MPVNVEIFTPILNTEVVVVEGEEAMHARDETNTDSSIPVLNVPASIEMEILDTSFVNDDTTEGEESAIGYHTVVIKDEDLNLDVEDEVAQVSKDSQSLINLAKIWLLFYFLRA